MPTNPLGLRRSRTSAPRPAGLDAVPAVLMETARVVWPTAQGLKITRAIRPATGSSDYAILPRAASPRWLLPAGARSTAAALVGQESGRVRRAAVHLLALGHRSGLAQRLPIRRLRVAGGDTGSLVAALREMVAPDADVAVRLGSWSHARSLVVRVFGPDGATLAFGKVGIDEHGRAAVRAEASSLTRVAGWGLTHVRTSEVLLHTDWRGLDVLLVSPLLPKGEAHPVAGLPVEAMLELARADATPPAPLAGSRWRASVSDRLRTVADQALRTELGAALAHLDVVEHLTLPLGPWHGDWTAWNMAWEGSRVLLWDWEHFAEEVPVGFDLVHYLAQDLRVSAGTGPAAEEAWRERATDALSQHVGLTGPRRDAVLVAYLLEVNLRFVLDRQHTDDSHVRRNGWGLDLLRREAQRLAATT